MIVCTLGMHRSGTSLASRLLNLLGVYLGPEQSVIHGSDDNPKGYWEHQPLARINDEILARFGGRWDQPPAFPDAWPRDPRIADLRQRAIQLLDNDFGTRPLWGWKDPRTCFTLPFWRELIGPMRYVLCVRNPCAMVASLYRRSGMSPEWAERLWLMHMQASLAHTSGQRRMFVFYEDVINDWEPELRRMAAFIGQPARADDCCVRRAVVDFVEQEMCHHRMSLEDLAGDPRISFPSKSLYAAIRGHVPRRCPADDRAERAINRTLDLLGHSSLEAWDRTMATSAQRDALMQENERLAASMREIHGSSAWRLVTTSRSLLGTVLPVGTRRRRAFNALLDRLVPA
jgi:hypothetical protein